MTPKVYLAGPITGLTYRDSENWRDAAKEDLKEVGIHGFSPMRAQEHTLANRGVLIASCYEDDPMTSADGIMVRDHWDVMTCDLMLVNLLGAKEKSLGTAIELGFAYAHRKPVVLVMEKKGNVHDHAMVRKAGVFGAETLEEGIELVKHILLP